MPIFEPPVAASHPSLLDSPSSSRSHKRKRRDKALRGQEEEEALASNVSQSLQDATNLEYTAVVSPLERIQRRVAGHDLVDPLPSHPFPHAASRERRTTRILTDVHPTEASRSLHFQHLAALTAIIHRSLLKKDFQRAARALGLMLREDVIARSAAIRNKGFMGIAAEILLQQDTVKATSESQPPSVVNISRNGLENAKKLYQTLIIRHPYHKSWPEAVNAVDFYLAMFNIWIYVVASESNLGGAEGDLGSVPSSPQSDQLDLQSLAKVRELEQANEIATRMDECMASVPYMDEPELIRLRAMVDLWLGDLYEACSLFALPLDQVSDLDDNENILDQKTPSTDYSHLASQMRESALQWLSKLEGRPRNSSPHE